MGPSLSLPAGDWAGDSNPSPATPRPSPFRHRRRRPKAVRCRWRRIPGSHPRGGGAGLSHLGGGDLQRRAGGSSRGGPARRGETAPRGGGGGARRRWLLPRGRRQWRRSFLWLGILGDGAAASGGEAESAMAASGVRGCAPSSLAARAARRWWVAVVAGWLLRRPPTRSEGQLFPLTLALFSPELVVGS